MMTMYEKVLLIMPSNRMPKDSVRRLVTPLGLLYIGAVLKKYGYDVTILDSPCEGYYNTTIEGNVITYGLSDKGVVNKIQQCDPDIVGVTCMFSDQLRLSLHYCDLVKMVTDVPVVLGGIHPSTFAEEIVKQRSVDYIIQGEGEYRMVKLLESLNKGVTPDFDGLASKGKVNPVVERIENLDHLPLPARELIDMERYLRIGVPFAPFPRKPRAEQVATTRGCPFNCVFCSSNHFWGRKLRKRSADNVIKEIDHLKNRYAVQEIQFSDDNLTADARRAKELFRKMIPYDIVWCMANGVMVQTLDKEMIELMAQSGCYQLTFAIESASQRVLKDIIHKKVPSTPKIKELIAICHENNIQVHATLIVGFPGETKEEIIQTLSYPFEVDIDSVSFFIVCPLPGSELYDQCIECGYTIGDNNVNFKSSTITIPKDSPDYIMSNQELEQLVIDYNTRVNNYLKTEKPEVWNEKFKLFLERHKEDADLILGRAT